jgi:hypothetical protein
MHDPDDTIAGVRATYYLGAEVLLYVERKRYDISKICRVIRHRWKCRAETSTASASALSQMRASREEREAGLAVTPICWALESSTSSAVMRVLNMSVCS